MGVAGAAAEVLRSELSDRIVVVILIHTVFVIGVIRKRQTDGIIHLFVRPRTTKCFCHLTYAIISRVLQRSNRNVHDKYGWNDEK